MSDTEIRLRCLEMALARNDPREAIALAREFLDFVFDDRSISVGRSSPSSSDISSKKPVCLRVDSRRAALEKDVLLFLFRNSQEEHISYGLV